MTKYRMAASRGDVSGFCAVDVMYEFRFRADQKGPLYGEYQVSGETIAKTALALVEELLSETQQYLLICDVHGKPYGMHFYVTPYLPKRIVTKKGTWKVTKRRPFYNANSGNMVQEVAITLMGRRYKKNDGDEEEANL